MGITLKTILIFTLGFMAQVLFFARTIVQWIKSEKAGKILSPVVFWQISLIASVMMLLYGILRKDFAIILGQLITFFIYVRNLQLQNAWKKIPVSFRTIIVIMPFICVGGMVASGNYSLESLLGKGEIKRWLLFFGVGAQLVFTFRFVYQWFVSEKNKISALPLGFWYISVTGSSMIITYAIFRRDPVLFLGHIGSMVMYIRNLMLHYTGKGLFDLLPFDLGVVKKRFNKIKKRNKKA